MGNTNEEELIQLKELYDELWHDAKSLIKDMKKSIGVCLYSAIMTFTVLILCISYSVMYCLALLSGETNALYYVGVIVEPLGCVILLVFGVKLLQWYVMFKRRYSKLIELERKIED